MLVDLSKKKSYNAKVIEIESKITSISGLATSAALILVENKISNVSGLAKKAYYDAKISDIESKYFTTTDYDKFASQALNAKIKQKELVDESAIAGSINNADLDKKSRTKSRTKSTIR